MVNVADFYRPDANAFERGYARVNNLRQDRARMQAGSAMAQDDYKGAASTLMTAGLPEEGARIARFSEMRAAEADKAKADQSTETWKYFGDMANRLIELNREKDDPEATVAAFDTYFAKGLRQRGETDEEIATVRAQLASNPTQTLRMLGAAAQSKLEIVKGSDGVTYTAVDPGSGRPVYSQAGPRKPDWKERTRADGSTEWFDLNAEAEEGQPQGSTPPAGGSGAKPATSGQPRNVRNNNPGNIKDGRFAQSLPGYAGSDGTFAIFDSRDAGHNAQVSLLQSYGNRGLNTVKAIIERWAPPSDNNPTTRYVDFVARKLGVSPRETLNMADPQVVSGLAAAIQQFEGGGPVQPYKVAAVGDTPPPPSGGRTVQGSAPKPGKARERRMTPDEVVAAGYQPGSVVMVNPDTGEETVKQGPGAGSGKITDGMRNVASLANDMLAANDQINTLAQSGVFRPSAQVVVSEHNGVTRLVARNPKDAQFVQAANAWLLPLLRKETGAAVTAPELATYMDTYIPLPNDDDDTVRQKAASRRRKMLSLLQQSRPAFADQFGTVPDTVTTYAPRRPGSKPAGRAASGPPAAAVEHLRKNPNLRAAFDAKYGAGAAAKALGK